jgi:transcription elongation factor GreA
VNEVLVTPEGLRNLRSELDALRAKRDGLVGRLRAALEHGGAETENGEYLDVRQEQDLLESRIAALERRLEVARTVEPELDGEVDIGERVRVRDVASGLESEYRIVGTGEGDPSEGDIAHDSPVGAGLLGRRAGDAVSIETPRGELRLEIVAVHG